MHNIEVREKWDKNIKKSYIMKRNNRLAIIYILNKSNGPGIQKRDFYEKKISFKTRNHPMDDDDDQLNHYFYFSSIESDVRISK
jgi:hypothetical protein